MLQKKTGYPKTEFKSKNWVITNLKSEVALIPSNPISRLIVELLGTSIIPEKEPKILISSHPTEVLITFKNTTLNMPEDVLPIFDGLIETVSWRNVKSTIQLLVKTQFSSPIHPVWSPGFPKRFIFELNRNQIIKRICGKKTVIDPGHGGKDWGAVGDAFRECDVVLQIGRKFHNWISTHQGISVLTRDKDINVSFQKRLETIHREKPDLFIGIHTGFDLQKNYRGTIILHRPDKISHRLALCFQKIIFKKQPFLLDLGIESSNDDLLANIQIPAVVILPEVITNHTGEGLLRDDDFQKCLSQSLFNGLIDYYCNNSL